MVKQACFLFLILSASVVTFQQVDGDVTKDASSTAEPSTGPTMETGAEESYESGEFPVVHESIGEVAEIPKKLEFTATPARFTPRRYVAETKIPVKVSPRLYSTVEKASRVPIEEASCLPKRIEFEASASGTSHSQEDALYDSDIDDPTESFSEESQELESLGSKEKVDERVYDNCSPEGSLSTQVILQVLHQLNDHGCGDKTVAELLQWIRKSADGGDLVLPPQPPAEVIIPPALEEEWIDDKEEFEQSTLYYQTHIQPQQPCVTSKT
jgi:hypothetical protein